MRQGPLAGRYPAVAAMVTLALIPYLALSAALDPLVPIISEQLHMSAQAMSLSSGLGNAAYAVGTVLAVQFAQHLPQRRMLLGLCGCARRGVGARGGGAERRHVHLRTRPAGLGHQHAVDRRRAAADDRLSEGQTAPHGRDHEYVRVRGGRPRPVHRRRAGRGARMATAVLDRRRDRAAGAGAWPR